MRIDENFFKSENPLKANRIEDILTEDEQILYRGKPNKKVLILESIFKGLPFVLIWAVFDAFFIFTIITTKAYEEMEFGFMLIPFFLIHLLPVWLYIARLVKNITSAKNIEYVFTDKRIIIRSGIIGIDFKTIFYTEVEGVTCKVGIFDRMFKVGDIYITAFNQSAVLMNLENPYFLLGKLQQITLDIKSDISYPNSLRPEENPGYNTKYKR